MKTPERIFKTTFGQAPVLFAAFLAFQSFVLSLRADLVYVPAQGRISQVVTESGQRQVLTGWNLPASGLVALDPTTGDLYTADQDDRAVYRIGRTNGFVTLVSGAGIGSGPEFSSHVFGLVVETNGSPVVVDGAGGNLALFRVDPNTGNRTILSAGSNSILPRGSGLSFQSPFGIALETSGNFLVTDLLRNAVIRVDRVSGDRSLVSGDPFGDNFGSGPTLNNPHGIAVGTNGIIFVSDSNASGSPRLLQINPLDGARTVFSAILWNTGGATFYGLGIGTNGILLAPWQIKNNNVGVGGAVLGLDPVTLNVSNISSTNSAVGGGAINPHQGTGPLFLFPVGLTIDRHGLLVVTDVLIRSLFVVDQLTGNRTILPGSRTGAGVELYAPRGIALGTDGVVVIADDGDSTPNAFGQVLSRQPLLVQVNSLTGDRSILSAGSNTSLQRGSGSNFDRPKGIARDSQGAFVVADSGSSNPKIVRVNPVSGDRVILASSSVGTGVNLVSPYGIAIEAGGNLIISDTGLNAVLRIDPTTGNRTVLSGAAAGTGPAFNSLRGISALRDGRIAVTDAGLGAVMLVDAVTGNRVVVSSSAVGSGPTFVSPCGIAENWQGHLLVVDNSTASVFKVNPNTGNRTEVSSSFLGKGPLIQSSPEFLTIGTPLELVLLQRQLNGVVQLSLRAPVGRQCVIEVSTNLKSWTELTNFMVTSITNLVSDTAAASQQVRFYRAHFTP